MNQTGDLSQPGATMHVLQGCSARKVHTHSRSQIPKGGGGGGHNQSSITRACWMNIPALDMHSLTPSPSYLCRNCIISNKTGVQACQNAYQPRASLQVGHALTTPPPVGVDAVRSWHPCRHICRFTHTTYTFLLRSGPRQHILTIKQCVLLTDSGAEPAGVSGCESFVRNLLF